MKKESRQMFFNFNLNLNFHSVSLFLLSSIKSTLLFISKIIKVIQNFKIVVYILTK